MQRARRLQLLSPLLIAAVWIGCGGEPDSTETQPAAPDASVTQPSEAALVILAKADAFDGEEDMVVSKCLGCALGMAGKADHVCKFGSYELHLCSEHCQDRFDTDPENAVVTARLPAALK